MSITSRKVGNCEHCQAEFRYELWHSGFGDLSYAYCGDCGMLATLSVWDPRWSKLPPSNSAHKEIESALDPYLLPCLCGGRFHNGAGPRCPHCRTLLSPVHASEFIERDAPGTAKGWRWQRSWSALYCIAIEDPSNPPNLKLMKNPFVEELGL